MWKQYQFISTIARIFGRESSDLDLKNYMASAFTEDWVVVKFKINSTVLSTACGELYINLSKNSKPVSEQYWVAANDFSCFGSDFHKKETGISGISLRDVNYGYWSDLKSFWRKAKV